MYEPFLKIEDVEQYFHHSIYIDDVEYTVIGASYDETSGELYIQAVDNSGIEISMTALNYFYSAKYKGKQFGKLKEVEDETI